MIFDAIVAAVITVIAVILGIAVHPFFLFLVVFAIVFLFARHSARGRAHA
jgi:hypothetical protein